MTEQTFKNLGKFVSYEEVEIKGLALIKVSYTQPRYQDPTKIWTMSIPEDTIKDSLLEKINNASSGEEYCFHTVKKEGETYSQLVDITDAKDAAVAAKKPWTGGSKQAYTPKDDTGITVGAGWTNAFSYYEVTGTKPENVKAVAALVDEIIKEKLRQEAEIRASKAKETEPNKASESAQTPPVKKPTKMEQMKAKKAAEKEATPEVDIEDDDVTFDDVE